MSVNPFRFVLWKRLNLTHERNTLSFCLVLLEHFLNICLESFAKKKTKKKNKHMFMATFCKIISWRNGDRVGLFYVLLDVSGLHFSHMLAMFSISPSSCKHFCELVVATATASLTEKTEFFFFFFFRLTPECTTSCRRISILFIMLTSKMPCWVCWQQARQVILGILVPTKPPTSFSGMS